MECKEELLRIVFYAKLWKQFHWCWKSLGISSDQARIHSMITQMWVDFLYRMHQVARSNHSLSCERLLMVEFTSNSIFTEFGEVNSPKAISWRYVKPSQYLLRKGIEQSYTINCWIVAILNSGPGKSWLIKKKTSNTNSPLSEIFFTVICTCAEDYYTVLSHYARSYWGYSSNTCCLFCC